jgi:hypothetical protein
MYWNQANRREADWKIEKASAQAVWQPVSQEESRLQAQDSIPGPVVV